MTSTFSALSLDIALGGVHLTEEHRELLYQVNTDLLTFEANVKAETTSSKSTSSDSTIRKFVIPLGRFQSKRIFINIYILKSMGHDVCSREVLTKLLIDG